MPNNLSKSLFILLLVSVSLNCWLALSSVSIKEDKSIEFSEDTLPYFKENRPDEYGYRKDLLRLKNPLGFVQEIMISLDKEKSGADRICIRAVISEEMLDQSWTIYYGNERVASNLKNKGRLRKSDTLHWADLEFAVSEYDLVDQTIYVELLGNRSVLLSRSTFKHIHKVLESINRETEYVHYIF